jgi:O-antigen/teichoic acid export membrane protein
VQAAAGMPRDGTVAPRVAERAHIADAIPGARRFRRGGASMDASSDRSPAGSPTVMDRGAQTTAGRRLPAALGRSQTGKAAALAAATAANNAIQLVFTLVFTRLLGASGYGTLAALISAFLVLLVAGQSVQVAAAREAALDRLGRPEALRATLRAWTRRLLGALLVVAAASALLREPLAALIGVEDAPWAAAAIPPTGVLWMLLSLQRGALQGQRAYGPVGASIVLEALGRLACALALFGAGLGVTGVLLGTPLAFVLVAIGLEAALHRRVGPMRATGPPLRSLRSLAGGGWAPILGLFLLAALQNVDVIVAKHEMSGVAAGGYAAAAVAAKSVVWVAIGIGLHLLPEATRRAAAGHDPRAVLLRALGLLAVVAAPALLIFAAAPGALLRLAFGAGLAHASGALLLLGGAMTLLAAAYLAVQYLVALGETRFLWVLGVMAVAEPVLLSASDQGVVAFAAVVLGVQCVAAAAVLALGLRARAVRLPVAPAR